MRNKERQVVWDAAMKYDYITVMAVVDKTLSYSHTSRLESLLL